MPPADGDHAAPDAAVPDSQRPDGATRVGDGQPSPEDEDPPDHVDVDVDLADADVDPVLFRTFWGAVIAVNVAMAAITLGVLLIHFRGDWDLGGLAIAVGAVAAAGAVRFYLTFRADRREDGEAKGDREP